MTEKKTRYRKPIKKEIVEPVKEAVTEEVKIEEPVKEAPKPKTKASKKKGYVKPSLLNVRTTPDKGNNVMCTLVKGTEVVINNVSSPVGWYNISAEKIPGVKVTGYVMSEFIKEV